MNTLDHPARPFNAFEQLQRVGTGLHWLGEKRASWHSDSENETKTTQGERDSKFNTWSHGDATEKEKYTRKTSSQSGPFSLLMPLMPAFICWVAA
jgi:hypothetical protein